MIRLILTLVIIGTIARCNSDALGQFYGQSTQQSVTLTVRADGSCELENKSVQSRAAAVQQVQMMERMQKMEEAEGDPAQMAALAGGRNTNTLTDDQLKQKFHDIMSTRTDRFGTAGEPDVLVDKDTVTSTTKSSFASIHDVLSDGALLVSQFEGTFEHVRFEQDTNSHLVVTLFPNTGMKRELKNMRSMLKASGMRMDMKFVLPGKIISSGFPETQTNATWIAVDATKDDSLDVMMKLYDAPNVITAEAGGLTIKEPLDSKNLLRMDPRAAEMGDDLPITDGATGFVVEAEGIVTIVTHIFPDGADYFKDSFGGQELPGTDVHAKLFPPKGRTLETVNNIKVLKATDDKGRTVAVGGTGDDEERSMAFVQNEMGEPGQSAGAEMQLHLELPAADAAAIDEINAEAVAVTAGAWKELVLTNLTEGSTNEFDLAAVLPGARLTISKFSTRNNMLTMRVQIKGPATIGYLKVQPQITGAADRNFGGSSDEGVKHQGSETTRTIRINSPLYNANGGTAPGPYNLQLRFPQDLRRERVNFKLKGLDLL